MANKNKYRQTDTKEKPILLDNSSQACFSLFVMKIHLDGMEDAAMDLWMVTTTTAQMGVSEDADPLATIEVGVAPTVVTGAEARLISQCKMQVGSSGCRVTLT